MFSSSLAGDAIVSAAGIGVGGVSLGACMYAAGVVLPPWRFAQDVPVDKKKMIDPSALSHYTSAVFGKWDTKRYITHPERVEWRAAQMVERGIARKRLIRGSASFLASCSVALCFAAAASAIVSETDRHYPRGHYLRSDRAFEGAAGFAAFALLALGAARGSRYLWADLKLSQLTYKKLHT